MTRAKTKAACSSVPLDPLVGQALTLLQEAVRERRLCHQAYSEFTLSLGRRFPTREESEKECALRSALGCAERAVMDAAEILTPNADVTGA